MKWLLDESHGTREYLHIDTDNVARVVRESDVDLTLRRAARARSEIDHAKARRNEFQFIGTIDMTVALMWHTLYGVDIWDNSPEMNKRLLRLLNNADWKLFKATDDTL